MLSVAVWFLSCCFISCFTINSKILKRFIYLVHVLLFGGGYGGEGG